jgi:hypothetical protein
MVSPLSLSWYEGVGFLAAEFLLFYLAGFLSGALLVWRNKRPGKCPQCGGELGLNGSYFSVGDPVKIEDILVLALFVLGNIGAWTVLLRWTIPSA